MVPASTCELSFVAPPTVEPAAGGQAECPCSRRSPTTASEVDCPPGTDWGVTETIGPEGGELTFETTPETRGVAIRVTIPPNALAEPTRIRLIETSLPPPAGFADRSPVFVVEPVGLRLAVPAKVRVPARGLWPNGDVNAIYWSSAAEPCSLEPLADDVDNAGFHEGTVTHLGWAVVGYPSAVLPAACR